MVLLHRDHPAEPRVILQVPNEARTQSETYVLMLDSEADVGWLESMPGARDVKHLLTYAQHVAFSPQTGFVEEIPDLDEPTQAQLMVALARMQGAPTEADRVFAARPRRQPPRTSLLRRLLGSRLAW